MVYGISIDHIEKEGVGRESCSPPHLDINLGNFPEITREKLSNCSPDLLPLFSRKHGKFTAPRFEVLVCP